MMKFDDFLLQIHGSGLEKCPNNGNSSDPVVFFVHELSYTRFFHIAISLRRRILKYQILSNAQKLSFFYENVYFSILKDFPFGRE